MILDMTMWAIEEDSVGYVSREALKMYVNVAWGTGLGGLVGLAWVGMVEGGVWGGLGDIVVEGVRVWMRVL